MWKYFLITTILWNAVQCEKLLSSNTSNVTIAALSVLNSGQRAASKVMLGRKIPDGYMAWEDLGSAYKLNVWQLPWNKARQICYSEGAQLAIINSIAERNILYDLMDIKGVQYAWLGVHDLYEKHDWVTVTGIPLAATGFSSWKVGEPNNSGGMEDCVELWTEKVRGMNDKNCSVSRAFICEAPLS